MTSKIDAAREAACRAYDPGWGFRTPADEDHGREQMRRAIDAYLAALGDDEMPKPVAMMIAPWDTDECGGDCLIWLEGCEALSAGDHLYPASAILALQRRLEIAEHERDVMHRVVKLSNKSDAVLKEHCRAIVAEGRVEALQQRVRELEAALGRRNEQRDQAIYEAGKAEGRCAELEEALRPFASIADSYAPEEDDQFEVWKDFDSLGASLPLRIFRRARALTTEKGE